MESAIPRVSAEEWIANYTVAVVSSPYAEKDSRESILDAWRKMVAGTWNTVVRPTAKRGGSSMPLKEVINTVKNAFGRAIRD